MTLRLAPAVLEPFKASGPGWQTRIEDTLRTALRKGCATGIPGRGKAPRAAAAKGSSGKARAGSKARDAAARRSPRGA